MAAEYEIINLEQGMPRAEQAMKKLTWMINSRKSTGVKAVKIIHGFGSSGAGGVLRVRCREHLSFLQRKGVINCFVPGESFSIFDAQSRKLLDSVAVLRRDSDLDRHNNGVTIVLL